MPVGAVPDKEEIEFENRLIKNEHAQRAFFKAGNCEIKEAFFYF
jgi:hypothetical protein